MFVMKPESICEFGESGFYFQRTHGRRLSNELHRHSFYEFLYVAEGSFVHEINGTSASVSEGDLIVMSDEPCHRVISQQENTDVIALSVTVGEADKFISLYGKERFFKNGFVYRLSHEKRTLLLRLCEDINFSQDDEYILRVRALLNQLLLFCIESKPNGGFIPPDFRETAEKMQNIALLREGTQAFVRISGYSHSQLCRLTQKYLNTTPSGYVNRIRMNRAYDMIVFGNASYEEICHALGFESFSWFSKLIKKSFGCTAAELRKASGNIRKTV